MDFKKVEELRNEELKLYEKELTNEFESIKSKVETMCKYMELLDKEFGKVELEKNKRLIS